ncbi:MAG: hypothetical protein ABFS03_10705 [Chloroflexota bacterium]
MKLLNEKHLLLVIILVTLFAVSACVQNPKEIENNGLPVVATVVPESSIDNSQSDDLAEEMPNTNAVTPVSSDSTLPEGENDTVDAVVLPTPRTEMEATDPSMVVLASGEIQLIEFFAFW